MFLSVSGNRSEQSTAHGQTDLRITNHRGHKFPRSLTPRSFKTRIEWPSVLKGNVHAFRNGSDVIYGPVFQLSVLQSVRTNQHAGIIWHIIQSEMRPRYYARCEMKFTLHAQKLRSVQRAEYKAFSADNTEKQNQSVNQKKQEMDPDKQCAWSTISLYWTTCYLDLSVIWQGKSILCQWRMKVLWDALRPCCLSNRQAT